MRIITNKDGKADGRIFNIGNPDNDLSVRELADKLVGNLRTFPEVAERVAKVNFDEVTAKEYYGVGYQDMNRRKPSITSISETLGWKPLVDSDTMLQRTVTYYVNEFLSREASVYDYYLRTRA